VHALDHLAFEALGAAGRGGEEAPGVLDLRLTRPEQAVGGLDLAGVDERLAVEAEALPLLALGGEAVGIVEAVVDSVEGGDARRPGGEEDGLERSGERRPAAAGAEAEVGGEVVGARDQPRRLRGDRRGGEDSRAPSRSWRGPACPSPARRSAPLRGRGVIGTTA
jgi:hypothetical protein